MIMLIFGEGREKRRPEMDTNGFYGDTFSSGFGDFYTAKRTPDLVRSGVKETSFPEAENLYLQFSTKTHVEKT